jgi:aspartyl-tRNA(Asn)/glutamyl-tRNA(Gln) amidotransferase subunit A
VSVPCGFDKNNLPVGFQLLGNYFEEEKIINFAHCYQKNTNWHKMFPEKFLK